MPQRWLPGEVATYIKTRLGSQFDLGEVVGERGRYPYMASISARGVRVFYSPSQLDMLIEISGEGCERMEHDGGLESIVQAHVDNLTRVDIATDILTDLDPQEFVDARTNKRHKSTETSISPTGTTCYVGSRRSDRFARVYRYAYPHPRAGLLRVELVYRGEQSKALARTWLEHGNDETAARAGNQYGWAHPSWEPRSTEKIEAWRPDRTTHNKMHWYHSQVKPAIRALVAQGHLTPQQLFEDLVPLPEGQKGVVMIIPTSGSVGGAKSK